MLIFAFLGEVVQESDCVGNRLWPLIRRLSIPAQGKMSTNHIFLSDPC